MAKVYNDTAYTGHPENTPAETLVRISHELQELLTSVPPSALHGDKFDPYAARLAAAGYRAIAQGLEDEAKHHERSI